MSMAKKTGDISEASGEVKYEWRIKNFLLLSDKVDIRYESPEFLCSGASWKMSINPNGETPKRSEGWIGVYVYKLSPEISMTVDYSLSLKTVDGKADKVKVHSTLFEKLGWGFANIIQRSELIEKKSELLPSGVLTVVCSLKDKKSNADGIGNSKKADAFAQTDGGTGIWELQQHFGEILQNGNVSDVVLKVADQEFKSHRSVLAARSPVFLAMMSHDTKEKNSGVVDIPDIDPITFSDLLNYLYTGSIQNLTSQNVVELFIAADKYQVDTLKNACIHHMLNNLSVEHFCDFLTLSLKYVEKNLMDACSQFFNENMLAILLTSKWQTFLNENSTAANELHIKSLKVKK